MFVSSFVSGSKQDDKTGLKEKKQFFPHTVTQNLPLTDFCEGMKKKNSEWIFKHKISFN